MLFTLNFVVVIFDRAKKSLWIALQAEGGEAEAVLVVLVVGVKRAGERGIQLQVRFERLVRAAQLEVDEPPDTAAPRVVFFS